MAKKAKTFKWIKATACIPAAAVILTAAILFFPLIGEKHVQVWSAGDEFDIASIRSVAKEGESFKILLIADTQLWMNPNDNRACLEQIKSLVEKTKPNMIATVGDNVSGVTSRFLLGDFIEVMDSFGIPWTVTFGNHDNEIPMTTLNWQADKLAEAKNSLFLKGPSNLYGCGNHAINITEDGKPVYTLFMFDNGRYFKYDDGSNKEAYMGYEQIAWYEWNVRGIASAAGRVVPSMTFSHFAQPEFREAIEKYGIKDEDGGYTIPAEYGFGYCSYLPGAAPVKSGFVSKCKELGSTKYIFCGHDHENNASIEYDGITYTYGLKTGPSPAPWNFAKETGGTLITISGHGEEQSVSIKHITVE